MSTRSLIGVKQPDGRIHAVTCHWDGYPDWVGKTLEEHYDTAAKANALINLGHLSSLNNKLAPDKEYDEPEYEFLGSDLVKHSIATPQKGVTVAYHRDHGDKLQILTFSHESRFYKGYELAEYFYLFKDGKWHTTKNFY